MPDRKEIIKAWENVLSRDPLDVAWDLIDETLTLLREQYSCENCAIAIEDRQPIVRCRDCIHYRYYGISRETVSECTIDHCENPDANWFCADGEREGTFRCPLENGGQYADQPTLREAT